MAATVTGPIREGQINNNLYVGEGFCTTIQKAVDFARSTPTQNFCVILPSGYVGNDAISAVTNGSAQVIISDQRGPSPQSYILQGAVYVAADFVQGSGYIAKGTPQPYPSTTAIGTTALGFSPTGAGGKGRGDLIVTATPGSAMPAIQLSAQPTDGGAAHTFFRADIDPTGNFRVQMPQALDLANMDGNINLWTGQTRALPGSKGMTIQAKPTEEAIDFQGQTVGGANDQTIRINPDGGNVEIARGVGASVNTGPLTVEGNAVVTGDEQIGGDLSVSGDLTADHADFNTSTVGNSPVRTFANSPDGGGPGGMIWPTFGIPISEGDSWRDPSIDPASLVPYPAAGVTVSTGTAWATPIDPATLATYPAAGVPVSTGTAWATPIDPATIPRTNTANTFTQNQIVLGRLLAEGTSSWFGKPEGVGAKGMSITPNAALNAIEIQGQTQGGANDQTIRLQAGGGDTSVGGIFRTEANTPAGVTTNGQGGCTIAWNISAGGGETDFINNHLSGFGAFSWYNVGASTLVNSSTVPVMRLDGTGTLNFKGAAGNLRLQSSANLTLPVPSGEATIRGGGQFPGTLNLSPGATGTDLNFGIDSQFSGSRAGEYRFWSGVDGSGANFVTAKIDRAGTETLVGDLGNLILRPTITGLGLNAGVATVRGGGGTRGSSLALSPGRTDDGLEFGIDSVAGDRSGAYRFWSGSDASGAGNVPVVTITRQGVITGSAKNFQIPYPGDPTKTLTHSTLESPEYSVSYRGEAVTADGSVELTLPEYFEALTRPEGRTVLLTQLFEQDTEDFAQLMASRVVDGKFRVRSSAPAAKFCWEVRAVRADMEPLVVVNPAVQWK